MVNKNTRNVVSFLHSKTIIKSSKGLYWCPKHQFTWFFTLLDNIRMVQLWTLGLSCKCMHLINKSKLEIDNKMKTEFMLRMRTQSGEITHKTLSVHAHCKCMNVIQNDEFIFN